MESLENPRPEEFLSKEEYEFMFKQPKDLSTDQILNILRGQEVSYFDSRDLKEVLLRRNVTFSEVNDSTHLSLLNFLSFLPLLGVLAFFGWKLYQSLKDRERRREEKKKLKQKKKK